MYKKFIIGITSLVVAVVVGYAFHLLSEYIHTTTSESKVLQKQKSSKELLTERIKVAKYMHELTNGLIVAENNKIGNVRTMNKKNIEEVLDMAKSIAVSGEQEHLVSIIEIWKKGDFSHIVEDHNMVWSMLDGEAGKAIKPYYAEIRKVKERLTKSY